MSASADGGLVFALIPLDDGHWELQIISAWNTDAPTVRTLQFEGDIPVDDQNFILPQLTPTPDGRFLLVRTLTLSFADYQRSAVVVLVDLQTFQIRWRRVSTDPLLAFSHWNFARDGRLIAADGPKTWDRATDDHSLGAEAIPYDILQVNPASQGEHQAALLSLPDLTPSLSCHYSVPPGEVTTEPMYDTDDEDGVAMTKPPPIEMDGTGCSALLKAAGVSSPVLLPGGPPAPLQTMGILPCAAFSLSTGRNVRIMNCRAPYAIRQDGQTVGAPFNDILFVDRHEPRFQVRVASNEDASAALASLDGQHYLLVLRKGLKLEVYKLPWHEGNAVSNRAQMSG